MSLKGRFPVFKKPRRPWPYFLVPVAGLLLVVLFFLPHTSAGTNARLTVTLQPDHTITLDPENGKLFDELSADPDNLLAPGAAVERKLAVHNQGGGDAAFTLRVAALDGGEFLSRLLFKVSSCSDGKVLYQGPLTGTDISLGKVEAKRERLFTLSVSMPEGLGNGYQGKTGHADFVFVSRETGGNDGNDRSSPRVDNVPEGVFVARWPGHLPLVKGAVRLETPQDEFTVALTCDPATLATVEAQGLEPRVYIWNERFERWVALASYPQDNGTVKAVNDGGYTGWTGVFAVRQPRFVDLTPNAWYEPVFNRANGLALLEGVPINVSCTSSSERLAQPHAEMTRAEFVAMVTRALGLVVENEQRMYSVLRSVQDDEVTDVLRKQYRDVHTIPGWCRSALTSALQSDLLEGVKGMDDAFGAATPISRLQAGVIISNALSRVPGYNFQAVAGDDELPSWARGRLAQGVLAGDGGGGLRPDEAITRAEAYTLFLRLLRELGW